ncbi:MAG: hypothetical protein VB106_00280 [Clostridiaceae bacterium]|jgi:hypothetical protein|nr:hypothetical protein [Clostridiaceae bacterium]
MQYVILILLLPATAYALSYTSYNWSHKNKKAAFGLALMVIVSIILSVINVVM